MKFITICVTILLLAVASEAFMPKFMGRARQRNRQYPNFRRMRPGTYNMDPNELPWLGMGMGKRKFMTELKELQKNEPVMEENLMRKKRSLDEDDFPQPMLGWNGASPSKRDLRRLRRDLGYGNSYADYTYPVYVQNEQDLEPSSASDEDIEKLMKSIEMLELLKDRYPDIDKYYAMRSSPSRFAPQPKLFPVETAARLHKPVREWAAKGLPEGTLVWTPEKKSYHRFTSMIPGFKRSVFREADRQTDNSPQNSEVTYGSFSPSDEMRIRRAAM